MDYYHVREFPPILEEAIAAVHRASGAGVTLEDARRAAEREGSERGAGRVTPLRERLARILGWDNAPPEIEDACCRAFLGPIFERGRVCPDTWETLARLRGEGYRIAIVSNTPWGSPGALWREELERLGLIQTVDASVFCTDVGWRKPARPIFEAALRALDADPAECIFVGDHPEWDAAGARGAGIAPVLLDRAGEHTGYTGVRIQALAGLWPLLTGRHA